jgi:catechol 2,3-dioxygenase-like lactoylglutathione lyase family enzyme
MNEETIFQHVALQCTDKEKAEIFFNEILGLTLIKTYELSEKLSEDIFEIKKRVNIMVYGNEKTYFEVFLTEQQIYHSFEHICIEIKDKETFIERCIKNGINPIYVKKGEKTLLFIRDFAHNLYEIK